MGRPVVPRGVDIRRRPRRSLRAVTGASLFLLLATTSVHADSGDDVVAPPFDSASTFEEPCALDGLSPLVDCVLSTHAGPDGSLQASASVTSPGGGAAPGVGRASARAEVSKAVTLRDAPAVRIRAQYVVTGADASAPIPPATLPIDGSSARTVLRLFLDGFGPLHELAADGGGRPAVAEDGSYSLSGTYFWGEGELFTGIVTVKVQLEATASVAASGFSRSGATVQITDVTAQVVAG